MLLAIGLDSYAKKKDGVKVTDNEKEFRLRQVCELGAPFWLFTGAVVFKACYIVPDLLNLPGLY